MIETALQVREKLNTSADCVAKVVARKSVLFSNTERAAWIWPVRLVRQCDETTERVHLFSSIHFWRRRTQEIAVFAAHPREV